VCAPLPLAPFWLFRVVLATHILFDHGLHTPTIFAVVRALSQKKVRTEFRMSLTGTVCIVLVIPRHRNASKWRWIECPTVTQCFSVYYGIVQCPYSNLEYHWTRTMDEAT
jgi:hypothetical protein